MILIKQGMFEIEVQEPYQIWWENLSCIDKDYYLTKYPNKGAEFYYDLTH